jgi:uncharacterized repeat protein (TIGR01451 family)
VSSISNTASLSGQSPADGNAANNSATASTTVTRSADIAVTKSDDPDPVLINEALTYTITVSNSGPSDAQSVNLSDALPAGLSNAKYCVDSASACDPSTGTNWSSPLSLSTIAAKSSKTVRIQATVGASAYPSITNTASVTSATADPTTPNSASAITTVNKRPTSTSVSCTDSSVPVFSTTTCTATVTDTATGNPSSPGGTVTFTNGGDPGTFSPSATCTLSPASSSTSTCSVTYQPTNGMNTTQTIKASYNATDGVHLNSSDGTGFAISVKPRLGIVSYIGQTFFMTSGSSATTAQVTLSASVADPDPAHSILSNATVTFKDLLTNKILASGVKVTPVSNTDTSTGTANTIVTLSTGQYGAQEYLVEVTLNGFYQNCQQLSVTNNPCGTAAIGSTQYEAAHPTILVIIPATINTMQGGTALAVPPAAATTPAGTYANATAARYTIGMKYNKGGTNPQGQIQLVLSTSDGTYYIKSNSITSLAFSTPAGGQPPKDVTIYTKASIYKILNGVLTSVDGNVSLRVDAHEGCPTSPTCSASSGDTIGFTVLSSKTGALYYSNNWAYDPPTASYRTVQQPVSNTGGTAVVIN